MLNCSALSVMKLDVFYYNVTKITQVSTLPLHTEREDFSKKVSRRNNARHSFIHINFQPKSKE